LTFIDNGIFGFDISTYQDAHTTPQIVDFQKMADYGTSFVIIRAGQGNFIDQDWHTHRVNSRGLLPRAPYWFYDPRIEPIYQADLCLSAIGNELFEGRVWLDLEFNWSGSYEAPRYWNLFRNRIKSRGFEYGTYTRKTWWDDRVTLAEALDFATDPFWVAQYNDVLDFIPKGVEHVMIWQDGTPPIGHEAGVESIEIDHNKWNSHFDFLVEWGTPSIPPVPGDSMLKYKVVWPSGVARRSAPSTSNSATSATPYSFNQVVDVIQDNILDAVSPTDINKRWVKFADGLFGASNYPDSDSPEVRMVKVEDNTPPTTPVRTHTIDVFSNGSLLIDGNPYPQA
jgi:hypothetical protein